MGLFGRNDLNDEIKKCLASLNESDTLKNETLERLNIAVQKLVRKTEELEQKYNTVVANIEKIENKLVQNSVAQQCETDSRMPITKSNVVNGEQVTESAVNESQNNVGRAMSNAGTAQANSVPNTQISGTVMKLVYSGFQNNAFQLVQKVGIGDQMLSNPMANFIIEYEKGLPTGYFYPNPENIKSLRFSAATSLQPVCDIVTDGNPIFSCIVVKGVVKLSENNAWEVTQKCKLKFND